MSNIPMPEQLKYIINKIKSENHSAYIVGGAVRDWLTGKVPTDYDICTDALPNKIIEIFNNHKLILTGLKHGTVAVIANNAQFEITTFRIDGDYIDFRHPNSVSFTSSLKEDVLRRDFTINALAYDIDNGVLDFVNGIKDINDKLVRCVGDPDKRFHEDALRIMRALRFSSCLGFSLDENTSISVFNNYHLLSDISVERILSEFVKLICGQNVQDVLRLYPKVFSLFIPEINNCLGFNQNSKYHDLDVWEHIIKTVGNIEPVVKLRLSAFFHDIGKPFCYTTNNNGGHFYGHAKISQEIAERVLIYLKASNQTINEVKTIINYHDTFFTGKENQIKLILNKVGSELFFDILKLQKSDAIAHARPYDELGLINAENIEKIAINILNKEECFSLKQLSVTGHDLLLLGLKENKKIGFVLNECLDAVINSKVNNNKSDLIDFVLKNYIHD